MKAMSNKGFGNGKATMDNGYGMFQNMLSYKLKERGKHLVVISIKSSMSLLRAQTTNAIKEPGISMF